LAESTFASGVARASSDWITGSEAGTGMVAGSWSRASPSSLAVNAFSTRAESSTVSVFFVGSARFAQTAMSSAETAPSISANRLSRQTPDASGARIGFEKFEPDFPADRRPGSCLKIACPLDCSTGWPPFEASGAMPLDLTPGRSGASMSSSPAIPTSVNSA